MSDINLVSKEFSNNHYLKTRIEDTSVFVDGPVKFTGTVLGANGSPFITGPIPKTEFNYIREDTSEQLLILGETDTINFNAVKMSAGVIDIKADSSCNIYCSNGITLDPGYYGSLVITGPMYDKNGNEITGGSKYISDDTAHNNLVLGRGKNGSTPNSIFVAGPIVLDGVTRCKNSIFVGLSDNVYRGHAKLYISDQDSGGIHGFVMEADDGNNHISSITLNSYMLSGYIKLQVGNTVLELDETKLNKLKEWLES